MADAPRPQPDPAPVKPEGVVDASAARNASVLDAVARISGVAPKLLLRDSPSEDGGSPILDTSSPELRQIRQLAAGHGGYELLGEIARGGMGVILKGHDRDLGRDIAVKVLRQELSQRPEILQRFVEEAQIGGQLQHPGIVPVYAMGLLADERPYFTMKLVKGRTLSALMAERAAPESDRHRFLAIFEQICQTMAYAHSKGVIHRDLKPANVMVGAFGEVQVLDWGLAKVLAQGGVADERRERERVSQASIIATLRHQPGSTGSDSLAGSVMGTPSYMPPEQARGEIDRLDERSDVFSLGAILCEILTGRPPYGGQPDEVMMLAANAELNDATKRLDECAADAELVTLAKRCLAPAPTARPRHAGVLAKEVAAWRGSLDERARAAQIAAAEARVKAENERRARRQTLALAAAVVVILVLGAGSWSVWSSKQAALQEQTREWQAQTESRVNGALADATLYRGQKKWNEALASMREALALLGAGQSSEELRGRVAAQVDVIEKESAEAKRQSDLDRQNRELLAQLKKLRAPDLEESERDAEQDTAYLDAFSAYELPIDDWNVFEAARALTQRGIAEPAAAALDDWAEVRRRLAKPDDAERLVAIALAADLDPVRSRLRRAIQIGDRLLLREFSRDEDLEQLPASSLNLLAAAFRKANDDIDALRVLKLAQLLHPEDYVVNFNLGLTYQKGRPPSIDEAVRCFQAALAAAPDDVALQLNIGYQLIANLGDVAQGMALLERARRGGAEMPEVHRRFGEACMFLGDSERAIPEFREAVRLRPASVSAHENLGWNLLDCGDPQAAITAFRESLRLDPGHEASHSGLGNALLEAGDITGARAEWQIAVQLGDTQIETRWLAADLYAAAGDREGAREALKRAIAGTPRSIVFLLVMASQNLVTFRDPELRDAAAAIDLARRAIEISPKAGGAWTVLGAALYRAGNFEGCIEAEELSRRLTAGGNAFQWYLLAMAHERLGRHPKALEWRRKADEWMEQHHSRDTKIVFFHDEARALIGE